MIVSSPLDSHRLPAAPVLPEGAGATGTFCLSALWIPVLIEYLFSPSGNLF
jgi:hypothetical protein